MAASTSTIPSSASESPPIELASEYAVERPPAGVPSVQYTFTKKYRLNYSIYDKYLQIRKSF